MASIKKARCTCVRCGKVEYLPAAGIDRSEPFLCERCDDKFIQFIHGEWTGEDAREGDALERFLKSPRGKSV